MKVLFDQGVPKPLQQYLEHHEVATAYEQGWAALKNSVLLSEAEQNGFHEKGRGACVFGKDIVKVYGELSLYDELVELCAEWERLGSPGLDHWALEFFPRDSLQQPEADEYTWVIPRKFTLEVAQLLSAAGRQP